MSSITSVSQNPFLYYQAALATQPASAPDSQTPRSAKSADNSDGRSTASLPLTSAQRPGGIFTKVVDAITQALQSALSDSATSPTDPNQAIQDAITKLLTPNTPSSPAKPSSTSDSDSDSDSASPSDTDAASLLQTLQNSGVSPTQFRQDFLSAVQGVAGGASSTVAQAFPPGSLINQTA